MHLPSACGLNSLAARLSSVAAPALITFLALLRKSPMTDTPQPAVATVAAAPIVAANDAAMTSAGGDQTAAAPAPAIDPTNVVTSIVQTVQNHPDVEPSKAAGIAASILSGLAQAEPAIFAVSRASAKTQGEVGLGLGLMEIILQAFMHPGS